jgi:hypothetical protein
MIIHGHQATRATILRWASWSSVNQHPYQYLRVLTLLTLITQSITTLAILNKKKDLF